MNDTIHVLSIGAGELIHRSYTTFLEQHHCAVVVIRGYRDAYRDFHDQDCDIAVLQPTLAPRELVETARIIRQRWPKARILIIHEEARYIEDALYDHRVKPGINPEHLLNAIQGIVDGQDVDFQPPLEGP